MLLSDKCWRSITPECCITRILRLAKWFDCACKYFYHLKLETIKVDIIHLAQYQITPVESFLVPGRFVASWLIHNFSIYNFLFLCTLNCYCGVDKILAKSGSCNLQILKSLLQTKLSVDARPLDPRFIIRIFYITYNIILLILNNNITVLTIILPTPWLYIPYIIYMYIFFKLCVYIIYTATDLVLNKSSKNWFSLLSPWPLLSE